MSWYVIAALAVVGGYVAAIFTWDRLHALFIGVEAKAKSLQAKARALLGRA